MLIGEWTTVDKTSWGPGAWQEEPDKIHWIDPATDLDCLMHRGPGGHWCGYVAVGPDHPLYERGYSECGQTPPCEDYCEHTAEGLIRVHGGLTFASKCAESADPATGICHVAQAGRPEHVWWFGFDCAHSSDMSPRHRETLRSYGIRDYFEVYRDRVYVEAEVRALAAQLAAHQ